jgi:glycosyltransferase involved in cell wall biosynthesis
VHAAWLRSRFHTWRARRGAYGLYQWLYGFTGEWLERWSYHRARNIVAVSQQVRRELIESGVDGERVRVIPNGVDTEEFRPASGTEQISGLPRGKLVLFIGDIKTPRKNLDTLLRAMVHVADATLVVAGEVAGSPYPRMATTLGLGGRVRFLGFRRDIPRLMRAATLFVFPSRYEACSLVLLEAAASGLPIVAGRATGGTELLTPECSVLLEDPSDHVELAAVLNRLLASAAQLAQMGQEARRVALRNTWQGMAEHYLRLYRELVDRRGGEDARDVHPRQAGTPGESR